MEKKITFLYNNFMENSMVESKFLKNSKFSPNCDVTVYAGIPTYSQKSQILITSQGNGMKVEIWQNWTVLIFNNVVHERDQWDIKIKNPQVISMSGSWVLMILVFLYITIFAHLHQAFIYFILTNFLSFSNRVLFLYYEFRYSL